MIAPHSMIVLLALLLAGTAAPSAPPVRLSSPAFGGQAEIELRGLPAAAAEEAMGEAFREIEAAERAADPERTADGGIAALNAAAGPGPPPAEPRLLKLLARALDFCFWSEKAHGPLARDLYRSWGLRAPVAALPTEERLAPAIAAAACNHLRLDAKKATATLDAGSALDLWGFAEGEAIDRAVEVLRQQD